MSEISALIVRMASENGTWGYTRIQGALADLGHEVARGTVANLLKEYGIDPAPLRISLTLWTGSRSALLSCTVLHAAKCIKKTAQV